MEIRENDFQQYYFYTYSAWQKDLENAARNNP